MRTFINFPFISHSGPRFAALLVYFLVILGHPPASGQGTLPPASFNKAYKPPSFQDSSRLKKMAAAFPVIDKIYREWAAKNHFPGLAYGIVADGQLIYAGNIGAAQLSAQKSAQLPGPSAAQQPAQSPSHPSVPQPVRGNSLFRIASMTKSCTAMAILRPRDQGRLSLEDPVYKYIPEIRKMPGLTADAPAITIR